MKSEKPSNNPEFVPVGEETTPQPSQEMTRIRRHRLDLLQCPLCDYNTRNKILLAYHEESHSKEKIFHCSDCNYETLNKTEYIKHKKIHKLPKMKCQLCNFTSKSKVSMKRHTRKHQKERNFNCCACTFVADNEKFLKIHVSMQHGSPKYISQTIKQEDCTESCVDSVTNNFENDGPSNMDIGNCLSFAIKTEDPVFECQFCEFSTTQHSELKQHNELYKHDKKYQCPMCGKKFMLGAWLLKHLNRKHGENLDARNLAAYECTYFSKPPPSTPQSLPTVALKAVSPIIKKESSAEKPLVSFSERSCKYDTSQNNLLEEPYETVNTPLKEKSGLYICEDCGYETKWMSVLVKHSRVHVDVKPFLCQQCPYSSKWKGDLNRHVAKHHGCDLRIKKENSVSSQKVVCSKWKKIGEKSRCAKEFKNDIFQPSPSQRRCLKTGKKGRKRSIKHLKTSKFASGKSKCSVTKRKYFCTFCQFNSHILSRFHTHIIHHFNKRPFTCSVCGINSNWKCEVDRHIRLKKDVDQKHYNACVKISNETGISSFRKYKKYLKVQRFSKPKPQKQRKGSRKIQERYPEDSAGPSTSHLSNVAAAVTDVSKSANITPNSAILLDSVRVNGLLGITMRNLQTQHLKLHSLNNFDREKAETFPPFNQNLELNDVSSVKTGPVTDMFQSGYCPMVSEEEKTVKDHERHHHEQSLNSGQFASNLCSYRSASQGSLTKHTKKFNINTKKKRNSSKMETNSFESDSTHITKKVPSYSCTKCPEVFMTSFELFKHTSYHGCRIVPFWCQDCDYGAKSREQLTKHMKSHSEARLSQVNASFSSCNDGDDIGLQNIHSRTKAQSSCTKHPEKLENSSELSSHSSCDEVTVLFYCPHCSYFAKSKSQLTNHVKMHSKKSVLKQPESRKDVVVGSQTLHSKKKNVNPPLGSTDFYQMLVLELYAVKKFLRDSDTKGPWKCPFCPAAFFQKPVLECHLSMHGSSGEFKCSECNYATVQSENLAEHLLLHSKPFKRYTCSKCPAVFVNNNKLKHHFKSHEQDKLFVCEHCDYSTNCAASLTKHKSIHNEADATFESCKKDDLDCFAVASSKPLNMSMVKNTEKLKTSKAEEKVFSCSECPYFNERKDAVMSHLVRHEQNVGIRCPYCSYSVRGENLIKKHILCHITPNTPRPEIFAKMDNYGISYYAADHQTVIFRDTDMKGNSNASFPPLDNDNFFPSLPEGTSVGNNTVEANFDNIERAVSNPSTVSFEKNNIRKGTVVEGNKDSQTGCTISSKMTLPEEYLTKVIHKDIISKKKSSNFQKSNLSETESRQSNKSGYQVKKVNKTKDEYQSKGHSSYSQKDGSLPSTSGINTKPSLKLKIKVANENTKKKLPYSIPAKKFAPINIFNEVSDRGFNVSKVQQLILAEGDPERGLSDNMEIEESSMHVQTDDCSSIRNASDKHNGISERDLGSFQLFHKLPMIEDTSIANYQVRPNTLKQLNPVMHRVSTNLKLA